MLDRARNEIGLAELGQLPGSALNAVIVADVVIKTGEQTLPAYLARPITDAMATGFIER